MTIQAWDPDGFLTRCVGIRLNLVSFDDVSLCDYECEHTFSMQFDLTDTCQTLLLCYPIL